MSFKDVLISASATEAQQDITARESVAEKNILSFLKMTTSAEIISGMNLVTKTNQRLRLLKFIKIKTNISSRLLNWISLGFRDKDVTSASAFLNSSLTIMPSKKKHLNVFT